MADERIARELDGLLDDYRARMARVRLEIPEAEKLSVGEAPLRAVSLREERESPAAELGGGMGGTGAETEQEREGLRPGVPTQVPRPRGAPLFPAWPRLPRRLAWILAALAAAVLAASGLWRWGGRPNGTRRSFPIPYTDTAGLAVAGDALFSVDRKRQLLFSFSADGMRIKTVEQFPNPAVSGLALGEGCLWSTDADTGYIYQHELEWKHSVLRAYANPSRNPTAIYWDGQHLWVYHAKTETVFQFLVRDSLVPIEQYTLPGITPIGLYVKDGILWVYDANTHRVLRFRLGVLATPLDTADISPWLSTRSVVTGFAVGPSGLWLITQNPSEILRFEPKSLTWVTHEFNPAAEGRYR